MINRVTGRKGGTSEPKNKEINDTFMSAFLSSRRILPQTFFGNNVIWERQATNMWRNAKQKMKNEKLQETDCEQRQCNQ